MEIDAKGMTPLDAKKIMRDGMLHNFKKDGFLAPITFIMVKDKLLIEQIPESFLESREEKQKLSAILRAIGEQPEVECIGVIYEAYGTLQTPGSEMIKLLQSGNLRVSDLNTRQDIICLSYSSRTEEDFIAYEVVPKTRTVKGRFAGEGKMTGLFSDLLVKRG